nr:hypothetical protein [Moraxella sp.]
MIIDRDLQNRILTDLSNVYPKWADITDIDEYYQQLDDRTLIANLKYLAQNELITECIDITTDGMYILQPTEITHTGLDFLADDGGLRAILNAVTVKIDPSQMAQLLKAIAEMPEAEQKTLLDSIKEAPSKAVETMVEKSVEKGFDNLPAWAALAIAAFN